MSGVIFLEVFVWVMGIVIIMPVALILITLIIAGLMNCFVRLFRKLKERKNE